MTTQEACDAWSQHADHPVRLFNYVKDQVSRAELLRFARHYGLGGEAERILNITLSSYQARFARLAVHLRSPANYLPDHALPHAPLETLVAAAEVTAVLTELYGYLQLAEPCDPRWRTTNVCELAQVIAQERCFERLPILADALMDAGCDDERLLAHCQQPGMHHRGCWALRYLDGSTPAPAPKPAKKRRPRFRGFGTHHRPD